MPTRVVCLGGGLTAVTVAERLRGPIRRGLVDLTIVSRDNFLVFHGFVPEMLCGKVQPGQIASPARRIFAPARFHNADIHHIDLPARTVTTSRLLDGRQHILPYDHLIVALGSRDDVSKYAGTAEHAQRLRSYWDCFKCRSHILDMLEMAQIEDDPIERQRLLTFVVVGGNYGGVEIATELEEYLRVLARREYAGIRAEEIRIVLVHSGDRILPELRARHEPLVAWAERRIARRGIEVRVNTRVQAATPEEIVLSSGERVASRTVISCAGTAQSPLLETLGAARDERGRIVVDAYLRVPGLDNVWAGGDCAAVPHPKGETCPALAIYAHTAGRQIGTNIRRTLEQRPLKPYRFTGLGDACTLGHRSAVGHLKGIRVTGFIAFVLWRVMCLRFLPTIDRKARVVIDWMLWPLLGRDVTNIRSEESYGIRREHYEPGQVIVRQGDIGHRLFVIWQGEVEVLRNTPAGAELLATLGPGQHFGEIAVFEHVRRTATVRARTAVEVISVGHVEALALSTLPSFDKAMRRPPA